MVLVLPLIVQVLLDLDKSVKLIGKLLFGSKMGPLVLNTMRIPRQPLVDDWDYLKKMVSP